MMSSILVVGAIIGLSLLVYFFWNKPSNNPINTKVTAYDFTLRSIYDEDYDLGKHKGEYILLVNTATHCGFTEQFEGLEDLHKSLEKDGLHVIGIPSSDFLNQSPGTNEEIAEFCKVSYAVSFPMMAKISVRGKDMHPLYQYLTEESHIQGPISWNFNKILVGPKGYVVERFGSRKSPEDIGQIFRDNYLTL